jgi:hypothetical protein
MQRLASRRPIQSMSHSLGALPGSSQSQRISCQQRDAHVPRRSRVALAVCPYLSSPRHGRAMARSRFARLQARCSGSQVAWVVLGLGTSGSTCPAASRGLGRLGVLCGKGRAAVGFGPVQVWFSQVARFSYSWAMPPRNAVQPNPSLKWSTNGVPSGLGHGCAHIFHGPGLPSRRRCSTYLKR